MFIESFLFKKHLEPDEEINYVAHKHWFFVFRPAVKVSFLGIFLPVLLWLIFPEFNKWIALGWIILGYLWLFYILFNWYLDAWLITSLSIIDVEWNGFFYRSMTRIEYINIEGVTYEISGFWATILNFGNILLNKASSDSQVALLGVKDPAGVEKEIQKHIVNRNSEKFENNNDETIQALSEMVAKHLAEKKKHWWDG